jgi:hypothetical protein
MSERAFVHRFIWTNFATSGGNFLIACNAQGPGRAMDRDHLAVAAKAVKSRPA